MTGRWPSVLIVTGSGVLMQIHSIAFWWHLVGPSGIAWSVMLEGSALWLWWQRRRVLAMAASALLIAGPFFEISQETVTAMLAGRTNQRLVDVTENEIAQLTASQARYDANSEKRVGWAERIDRTQTDLAAARATLRQLLAAPEASRSTWRDVAAIALQGLALLMVMTTQILAVSSLQPETKKKEQPDRQAKPGEPGLSPTTPGSTQADPAETDYDRLVTHVAKSVETEIAAGNASGKSLAEQCGVRPADISMIRKHSSRRQAGRELVSESALRKVAAGLGLQTKEIA